MSKLINALPKVTFFWTFSNTVLGLREVHDTRRAMYDLLDLCLQACWKAFMHLNLHVRRIFCWLNAGRSSCAYWGNIWATAHAWDSWQKWENGSFAIQGSSGCKRGIQLPKSPELPGYLLCWLRSPPAWKGPYSCSLALLSVKVHVLKQSANKIATAKKNALADLTSETMSQDRSLSESNT